MNNRKTKKYVILVIAIYVISLVMGAIMSISSKFLIEDLEVVVEDYKDGYFYLMKTGNKDTRVLKINAEGEIVDKNVMKVSNWLNDYIVEYEGSVLRVSNGYLYCIRRWIDSETMKVMQRDIVRLDADRLSSKPEILYSYERQGETMPNITDLMVKNDNLYVALIASDGLKAYCDKIDLNQANKSNEVKRLMSLTSPISDKFINVVSNRNGEVVALTKGGRVYLYDQKYDSKLIYPHSIVDNNYVTSISVDKDDNVILYNQENGNIEIHDCNNIHSNVESLRQYENILLKKLLNNQDYILLCFAFSYYSDDKIALVTTRSPETDECKIVKLTGQDQYKVFNNIKYSKNVLFLETLNQSFKIFFISLCILIGLNVILCIIKKGKRIVYKFILVIIPILAIAFVVLGYKQSHDNKQVMDDLKIANAMTVNHATINNVNTSLVRKLRDNLDSYWDGTYQKVYDEIKIFDQENSRFADISNDILAGNKIAGIDNNYIYNEVFLVKDGNIYTGVSDKSGYMVPMGTQYFEGTENLFEKLRVTGLPQKGTIVSKTYKGGVYVTPIIDSNEMVGMLATTFDTYIISRFISDSVKIFIRVAFYLIIAISFPIFIMFTIVLKPLKELERAVNKLAEGNYAVKLDDTGSDEFSYIRNAFNKMCNQLSGSIYRVNNISQSYFRFVPRHMFYILDKKDILDVKLGDKRNIECILVTHTLYNFHDIEKNIIENGGDNLSNIVKFINKYFSIVYNGLKEKNGSLLSNDLNLNKIESIFLDGEKQAVEYSIGIIKKLSTEERLNEFVKLDMSIIIYKTDILYGIVGEEERSFPFVLSIEKEQVDDILFNFELSGAKIIITEDIKNTLKSWYELNIRYIGYSSINNGKKHIKMYEVLDCCDIISQQQKESTSVAFQNALDLFYKKEFYLARNEFSKVVKKSPLDNVARWYLFLSDKYCNTNIKDYNLELYGDKEINIHD